MRKLAFALLCLVPLSGYGQKRDQVWLAGNANLLGDSTHGGIVLDFNMAPRKAYYQYREANLFIANASICDTSGSLLFYTNGCNIYGSNHEVLPNGEEINPGFFHETRCNQFNRGYGGGFPNVVILPLPESDKHYYLFHQKVGGEQQNLYVDRFLYSVIEQKSVGQLAVVEKNVDLMEDFISTGELSAVKHANGIDWWVITPRRNSNEFYCFLFTKDGIVDTLLQTIGDLAPAEEEGSGQTTFSHDGTMMARYYPQHPLMLYHFDRATGQFSNYRTVNIDFGNHLAFDGGCYFSPNGRYLYVTALIRVYQFDLWASDISASQTLVGEWDGFKDPIAVTFGDCQLGPDCKIYVVSADMRYYHIIHNPDEPGLACNFEQRGLVLPTPSGASIPYFPNYRLGPIDKPGVPCSPTVSVGPGPVREVSGVRLWPNPATDLLTIQYPNASEASAWLITNAYGQIMQRGDWAAGAATTEVDISKLPSGSYFFRLQGQDGRSSSRLFTVFRP